ncbi:MAG: DUF1566 domain-containing protein [Desulfuromonadaceae bacterium]|nr:DUF1566 domain-containing protein [Desulfuromonadaceae bacterium]MDD5106499.1 DUF1566 domain-containing protein [Desulfuromonadaceae bacterium]
MKKLLLLFPAVLLLFACSSAKPNFVFQEKTAVDQNTGLTWTRNANMAGHQLVWRGDDNVYEYMKRLNETNYAGYADWRVPSKEEMSALIEYAKSMGYDRAKMDSWPYQKLRQLGFIDVRDYEYWTSSRQSQSEIWTADLTTGIIAPKPEAKPYYLWPIRGTSLR